MMRNVLLLTVAFALAGVPLHAWSQGTSFSVDYPLDGVDANPGDGVCATTEGNCTLRAAIQETNALPGRDAITLGPGRYYLSVRGADEDAAATGDVDITDDLEIRGAGADLTALDGDLPAIGAPLFDSILDVAPGATAVVSALTIQHGIRGAVNDGSLTLTDVVVRDNFSGTPGGGIANLGMMTLDRTIVRDNEAMDGGGIANAGSLTIIDSVFSHNGWPGSEAAGGGILNVGSMALENVAFRDNGAFFGGAITNGGIATLNKVKLQGNVGLFAAGILNDNNMAISGSVLTGHTGVPIRNGSEGTMSLINTTISGNGTGLLNEHTADATLLNVTISGNTGRGIVNWNGPLPNQTIFPTVTVTNSIVAGNGAQDCADSNPDLEPTISGGHNISGDGTCAFNGPGDMMNTDPLLGPLADNGGPTQTLALLQRSPAIDAGNNAGCPAADQRGFTRPFDGDGDGEPVCDIGAYESHHCVGDVNDDGAVDVADVKLVGKSMHARPGSNRWNGAADVNRDGVVDVADLSAVLRERKAGTCP